MDRFDEDASVMRERRAATLIDLLKPELPPQSKARAIINGGCGRLLLRESINRMVTGVDRGLSEDVYNQALHRSKVCVADMILRATTNRHTEFSRHHAAPDVCSRGLVGEKLLASAWKARNDWHRKI